MHTFNKNVNITNKYYIDKTNKRTILIKTNFSRSFFFLAYFLVFFLFLNSAQAKFANNLYHTNDELFNEFNTLLTTCENIMEKFELKKDNFSDNQVPIYSITSSDFDSLSSKSNTVFMLFGEHAREIIPTEVSLFLAKALCNKNENYSKNTISKILKNTKVYILPVLNPESRNKVVQGDYCKRTNENNVDLNRNWDS